MINTSQKRKLKRKKRRKGPSFGFLFLSLLGCCFVSLSVTWILYTQTLHTGQSSHSLRVRDREEGRPLAGLSCIAYGGPVDPSEMVYWQDIPSDSRFVSPLTIQPGKRQFMTFEPDRGGFNNVRMAMETIMVMAHSMGRVLVLPPDQEMYLLDDDKNKGFGFQDFFPMEKIAMEQSGLEFMTTEEFLRTEGLAGHLRDRRGKVAFPPHNRTNWNGRSNKILQVLHPWQRTVAVMPSWSPDHCLAVFPASTNPANVENLEALLATVRSNGGFPRIEKYFDHPTPVNASIMDRLAENHAGREELCIYNQTLQNEPVLHFHGKPKLGGRLLTHFYSFLLFEDWKQDLWAKRFVRDHLRYKDEIPCTAARIVEALRARAPVFDAFCIRTRGEFEYKKTRVTAAEIYEI